MGRRKNKSGGHKFRSHQPTILWWDSLPEIELPEQSADAEGFFEVEYETPLEHPWLDSEVDAPFYPMEGTLDFIYDFDSEILENSRNIALYLPPSYYVDPDKYYPVLYMHDGNNIFAAGTSFSGMEWDMELTLDHLIQNNQIQEIILVGIYNTEARDDEYTPIEDLEEEGGGKGLDYLDFITEELMPRINSEYRTLEGPEHTAIMGSSLGGLISIVAAYLYPQYFGMVGALSPSLWWADHFMLKEFVPARERQNVLFYVDMGGQEGDDDEECAEGLEDARTFCAQLIEQGYVEGQDLIYLEDLEADHSERSWAERVHIPLRFFFGIDSDN